MALRITQNQLYGGFISNMNNSLVKLAEYNYQSHTQLKVNRPSDDPAAAGLIISGRATLERLSLYNENLNTAKGWLSAADSTLTGEGSVMSLVSSIRQLAVQASTGSYTKENRLQIGKEIRESYDQLINLANTNFGGKYIFGGQKTTSPPYSIGLAVSSNETKLRCTGMGQDAIKDISGSFKADLSVQFGSISADGKSLTYKYNYADNKGNPLQSEEITALIKNDGTVELDLPGGKVKLDTTSSDFNLSSTLRIQEPKVEGQTKESILFQAMEDGLAKDVSFRCTSDGGKTWTSISPNPNHETDPDGNIILTSPDGVKLTLNPNTQVSKVDTEKENSKDNGTWIYIRPSAVYKGDDNDNQVVMSYANQNSNISANASGYFARDVSVKIVGIEGDTVKYAYSLDDGLSWTHTDAKSGSGETRLSVPGGFLSLSGTLNAGEQFTVHPHRADINIPISDSSSVTVNLVGKEIFGGQYIDPSTGHLYSVGGDDNLFDVIGALISYCETGDQDGIQSCLEPLQKVMDNITSQAAIIGGRSNRVSSTMAQVDARAFEEEDRLSDLEDADFSELMLKISQQQVAYNSVLKSSSMIMQMSLVNFL